MTWGREEFELALVSSEQTHEQAARTASDCEWSQQKRLVRCDEGSGVGTNDAMKRRVLILQKYEADEPLDGS